MPRAQTQTSVADILKYHNECTRTGNYEFIGVISLIILEAAKNANVPAANVASRVGSRLDFYNEGVALGQSKDHSELLFIGPIRRQDGKVGLPDIPDPDWRPRQPTSEEITGLVPFIPDTPRMIAQTLEERACADEAGRPQKLRGTNFLVFQPVAQILVRPTNLAEGWIITPILENSGGRQMALLVDPFTGEAHFYGGRYVISRPGA